MSRIHGTPALVALFDLFLTVSAFAPPNAARAGILEGYGTEMSVVRGSILELHVRTTYDHYDLSILQQRETLVPVTGLGSFQGFDFAVPDSAWLGCNWPVTNTIATGSNWRPGAYVARLTAANETFDIPFVVRTESPGSFGRILVQLSTHTWQAYNQYGGKSLYGAYEPGLIGRAHRVSYHRPLKDPTPTTTYQSVWAFPFLSFLESQGWLYEVCTSVDVHREPGLLDAYGLFVSMGHDEYYSKEMFDELERFANSGGNLAFFSANTLYWQVRLEDDEHTIVCYKDATLDPMTGIDNTRVTVRWHLAPVFRPPAALMGIYYNGSWGIGQGPYEVHDPNHWAYAGVSVVEGQQFGYPMVGFEVDSRTPDSPANVEVIARTDLPDHNDGEILRPAEMVFHVRPGGGEVFAGGTVNYTQGIVDYFNGWTGTQGQVDPVAVAVTNNVLARLSADVTATVNHTTPTMSVQVVPDSRNVILLVTSPLRGYGTVYDVLGRRIATLGPIPSGLTRFALERTAFHSEVYFVGIKHEAGTRTSCKFLVLR